MAKQAISRFMYLSILFVSIVFLAGCGDLNMFNSAFLDQYEPLGISSLDLVEGKGPVVVIIENLTTEACHGEYCNVVVYYVDESGAQRTYPVRNIPAVSEENRDPTGANFDASFRRTVILNCGVRKIWIEATIYRRSIVSEENDQQFILERDANGDPVHRTVTLPDGTSQQFTYGHFEGHSESGTGNAEKVTVCRIDSTKFDSISAIRVPPTSVLEETKHFKCGDVIVFGILDHLRSDGEISTPTYTCRLTYFTENDFLCNGRKRQIYNETTQQYDDINNPTDSVYYEDPNHVLLTEFYQYPDAYIILPMVLPGTDVSTAANAAASSLIRQVQAMSQEIDEQLAGEE